jgi:two-component system cell cycle sensor histidine kinase/response regulator CckA
LNDTANENGQATTQRRKTIFFVDDDDQLRGVTGRLLRGRGYEVVEADSAERATQVLEEFEGTIDALLMDINLPDGWGASVAQRLREGHPEMVVIYTTGFAEVDPILSGALNDAQYVARKPFTTDQLVEVVERAIAERLKG